MAHRRLTFDPHSSENTLLVGSKYPRANGGNIKDKISLWEGKEVTHSPISSGLSSQCASVQRTESLTKCNSKTTDELSAESCKRVAHKENLGKENVGKLGDSRPCSPVGTGKQLTGTLTSSKPSENQKPESGRKVAHKDNQNQEKEKVEQLGDSTPCSPVVQQQVGTSKKSKDKKKSEQTTKEKRDVFTLFKKLDAMGENHGKTPPELGNYFSPPSKDKQVEVKKRESDAVSQSSAVKSSGVREVKEHQENVYTEPGSLPINPVPKPRRTFQHPTAVPTEKNQSLGRAQRNLPPLPSISTRSSSKPPSGVYGRPRGERMRDNTNRYVEIRKLIMLHYGEDNLICIVVITITGNPLSSKTLRGQLALSSLAHCLRNITMKTSWVRQVCHSFLISLFKSAITCCRSYFNAWEGLFCHMKYFFSIPKILFDLFCRLLQGEPI